MAIYRLLKDTEFGAEAIAAMIMAFNAALETLRVIDNMSPAAVLIAKNIVDAARRGERDPARLYDKALGPFKPADASNPFGPSKPADQIKASGPKKASVRTKSSQAKAKVLTKALNRRKTSARSKPSTPANTLGPAKG